MEIWAVVASRGVLPRSAAPTYSVGYRPVRSARQVDDENLAV